jgi:uroporphyrinogen-III synthase
MPARGDAPGALTGRAVLVTRPQAQAVSLAARIVARGGTARIFPLLVIAPIDDSAPRDATIAALASYRFAAFVSPNAVAASVPLILARGPWPTATRPVAVGSGTARALAARGVAGAIVPDERFDSEALLAMPELAATAVAGHRVVIFRGDGGRELLADTLRARGAQVDCVSCYRRLPPADFTVLDGWLAAGELDALSVTSSEALAHLVAGVSPALRARLLALPLFTSHPRIAEAAAAAGFASRVLTDAGDEALVASLCAYNWPAAAARR